MPKIVRDLTILIAFCGAFYLLVVFVRGDSPGPETTSNFSIDRLEGDRMMKIGNWEQAIEHFSRLVKKDKYNGLAQANLCLANIEVLFEQGEAFEKAKRSNTYSQTQMDTQWKSLQQRAEQCIESQKGLAQFDYYRGTVSRNLAQLHCFLGNEDKAIQYARRYVKGGLHHGGPLSSDRKLRPLRNRPDFQQLLQLERSYFTYF